MTDEQVIRAEARSFHEEFITNSDNKPLNLFLAVKKELEHFYAFEYKAIYLDELKIAIDQALLQHRNLSHKGEASPNCPDEIQAEMLAFYIKQELSTYPTIVHSTEKANPEHQRTKVFVSYSHKDKAYLDEIRTMFKSVKNQIDFWDDSRIQPGQKWKEEIEKAMNQAKVAILMVSSDFLASEFITENELPPLLEAAKSDGAAILIVVLRPCLIDMFPDLMEYQAMHQIDKQVVKMTDIEREELYVNLVKQTKKVLEQKSA